MKKITLVLSIFMLTTTTFSQATKKAVVSKATGFPVKGNLVQIINWDGLGNWYMPNYWVGNKKAIVSQIGAKEFELIKKNCDERVWPNIFKERTDADGNNISSEKFKNLKTYQIARFTNTNVKGEKFNEMVILRVPVKENKAVLNDEEWTNDIYFIINAANVK
jgi:hypothetical protein